MVSKYLFSELEKEIVTYVRHISRGVFHSYNINDIKERYIKELKNDLMNKPNIKPRIAEKIARNLVEDLINKTLNPIN